MSGEPLARFFGMIAEGTESAAIDDDTALVDDVDALGPRGVG